MRLKDIASNFARRARNKKKAGPIVLKMRTL